MWAKNTKVRVAGVQRGRERIDRAREAARCKGQVGVLPAPSRHVESKEPEGISGAATRRMDIRAWSAEGWSKPGTTR